MYFVSRLLIRWQKLAQFYQCGISELINLMIFYAGCPVPQAYDPEGVGVSDIPRGTVGKTVTFAGIYRCPTWQVATTTTNSILLFSMYTACTKTTTTVIIIIHHLYCACLLSANNCMTRHVIWGFTEFVIRNGFCSNLAVTDRMFSLLMFCMH